MSCPKIGLHIENKKSKKMKKSKKTPPRKMSKKINLTAAFLINRGRNFGAFLFFLRSLL